MDKWPWLLSWNSRQTPSPGPSSRWPAPAWPASIYLLALLYFTLCMNRSVNAYDEGIVLVGAQRVLRGDVPHRDFYAIYGPAQFYVVAGLFRLLGTWVGWERSWDTLVRAFIVATVFGLTRRLASPVAAWLTAGASLTWLGYVGFYGYPAFPALACVLAAVACLRLAGEAPPWSRILLAGLCLGAATLFRYDVGVAALVCLCAVLALRGMLLSGQVGQTLAACCTGWLLVVLPVALLFWSAGGLPDLWFDVVLFQSRNYARMRSLPFPSWADMAVWKMAFSVYIPFVAAAACGLELGRLAWPRNGAPRNRQQRLILATLLLLTLMLIAKGYVRISPVHMSLALVVCLILLAALANSWRQMGWISRAPLAVAMAMSADFTWLCATDALARVRANIAWAEHAPDDCRTAAPSPTLACFLVGADTESTVRYIQARTAPDDPVFVGLSRHDRIFVNDLLLYFALDRPAATKWHDFNPGLQTSLRIQLEMVGELRRARPKFIVLEDRWTEIREPNDSAKSSGVRVLDNYLQAGFRPVAKFGDNTVLQTK